MRLPEKLVFATNNTHKLEEARAIIGALASRTATQCRLLSLDEIGCHDDVEETADTLEGNALIKARWIAERYGLPCFADDTGLEVAALGGAPGVHSARYATEGHDFEANVRLLLHNLEGVSDRRARFRTVVALILDGQEYTFEGIVNGTIAESPRGGEGFGYDPVFIPDGYAETFAQMPAGLKNAISHRAIAVRRFAEFMQERREA